MLEKSKIFMYMILRLVELQLMEKSDEYMNYILVAFDDWLNSYRLVLM